MTQQWNYKSPWIRLLLFFVVIIQDLFASTQQPLNKRQYLEWLMENYDKRIHPYEERGQPTIVRINMVIQDMSQINDQNMDYRITMFFRQRWNDPRLANETSNYTITLTHESLNDIWVPDTYFTNEKQGMRHKITIDNVFARVDPMGNVLLSQRLSMTLACPMKLEKFPMDTQDCRIRMHSWGYRLEDVELHWTNNSVIIKKELELPEFAIDDKIISERCISKTDTGRYPCIRAQIRLHREFGYYMIQVFIPSMLIVVLSWISFWIDVNAVPARITVGLLTVLAITTQSSGTVSRLPRVSYIKNDPPAELSVPGDDNECLSVWMCLLSGAAIFYLVRLACLLAPPWGKFSSMREWIFWNAIDVWMATCLVFVFGALLEFAFANVLARREAMQRLKRLRDHGENTTKAKKTLYAVKDGSVYILPEVYMVSQDAVPKLSSSTTASTQTCAVDPVMQVQQCRASITAETLDCIARLLFPAAFMVMNTVFWCFYLLFKPDEVS